MPEENLQVPSQQAAAPAAAAPARAVPLKAGGMAVASLVLGIIGFLTALIFIGFLVGVVGLILGIIAMSKASKGEAGGKGVAVAGTVLSGLSMAMGLFMPIVAAIAIPALVSSKQHAYMTKDMVNLKQLGMAAQMYADDNDDKFPDNLSELYPDYVGDIKLFLDPWHTDAVITEDSIDTLSSYTIVPGMTVFKDVNTILIYNLSQMDKQDKVNVYFVGHNVEPMFVNELRERLIQQQHEDITHF
ncbi:MAG: DUF4190 domain-containing protein [Planctomycetes bacterium]|nr:DUF4190 domain-containing protein [Planctomycetota bacterium]